MTHLRIVEAFPEQREPGMMWRYANGDVDGRECWWIVLPHHPDLGTPGHPSQISFRTTQRASDPPNEMWDVTGTPPNITINPSIDVERFISNPNFNPELPASETNPKHIREGSYWHGWIKDGEMTP